MRRGLVALLFMAACNGGQGVDIEVHAASTSIDSVELWLAYGVCKLPDGSGTCDGIGWPNAQLRPSGEVYTLGEDEKLVTAEMVNGVAQLHLEATPNNNSPYVIAVVGYQGGAIAGVKMLSGAEIPLSDQAHWRIELDDVGQVTENLTAAPGDKPTRNALVWDRQPSSTMRDVTGYTGCFAYQKWTGTEWETKYIVPPSDPDCDGDPPDCNPYWYDASVDNAVCVGEPTNLANVCAVGKLLCTAETKSSGCTVQTNPLICVPSNVCTVCGDSPDLVTCLRDQVPAITPMSTTVPMQACTMVMDVDGPCINNNLQTPPGWQTKFFIGGGACVPNSANQIAMLRPVNAPFSGGGPMMSVSGADIVVHASPVTSGSLGCQIDVTWVGGNASVAVRPVILAVSFGPGREILVPLLLDFKQPPDGAGQCPSTTPEACTQLGNWPETGMGGDSMFQCTR